MNWGVAQLTHAAALTLDIDPGRGAGALVEARHQLRAWLIRAGLVEATMHEVLLAVGEATSNALEHAGAPTGPVGPAAIRVRAELLEGDALLRVNVSDRGSWLEREADPDSLSNRGRGLLLMAALMDRVELHTGPTGTTVELTKHLRASSTPDLPSRAAPVHHEPDVAVV